jgi:chorismate mutase
MHVAPLLRAAGASGLPVLLKRGMSATLEEFLLATETILLEGDGGVVLCERGIRTFDTYTRNCLDVGGIAALKRLTHLPVLADPSHATGRRELVADTALAAVAAGADGLVVEAHVDPASALSDAGQQLPPSELSDLSERVRRVALALGRSFHEGTPRETSDEAAPDRFVARLREEISKNDRGIVEAINARLELVARMQRYKAANGIAFHDPRRERSLVRSLQESNEGPLSAEGLEEILLALLDLTKREVA